MPYVFIISQSKRSRAGVALGGFGAVSDFTESVYDSCLVSSLLTEHGSGEGAAVVGGCHDFTVGSGGAESDEVSTVGEGKVFVLAEDIAAFADRANDIIGRCGSLVSRGDVLREVVSIVERGADEVREAGIDDEELLGVPLFHIEHTGNEAATLCHDATSEFKVQLLVFTQVQMTGEKVEVVSEGRNGVGIGGNIVNAESAADVDAGKRDALGAEFLLPFVDVFAEVAEGFRLGDLRADVIVHTHQFQVVQRFDEGDDLHEIFGRNAEFVLVESRGDFGVGVGIDVGIDAEGNACSDAERGGNRVDDFQFGCAFHVETTDARFQGETYLFVRLSHSGEHDFVGGKTGVQGSLHFATGHAVGTESFGCDELQDARICVRFDGIVNVKAGVGFFCFFQFIESLLKKGEVVEIERRFDVLKSRNGEIHGRVVC